MTNTLRVIDSFFIADEGDMFQLDKETGNYSLEKSENFYKVADDAGSDIRSSYSTKFEISPEYAEELIKDGYLENEKENKTSNKPFVNVFDEIDGLIDKYSADLNEAQNDENLPLCLRVEKETVYNNLIKVLNYLKDLKK